MKCEEVRRYAGAYLDSELDPKTSLEVARHLDGCAECKTRFEAEGNMERALAKELARPEPGDDATWERALRRAQGSRSGRWRWAAGASGGLAAAGALVWLLALGGDGIASDLRKDHQKHRQGGSPLELSSRNPREVEEFFKDRMGLSVPVPVPAGWDLVGGRKCALRGIPTAFILYRLQGRDVTAYVFPGDHLDRFKGAGSLQDPLMDEAGEIRVAALRSGPHVIGAAGTVHCHELLALCRAFGN
jgi:anti-sigma factor RsiW